ncbi:hypothetical protein [uncultured Bacteroides sp.]|uniref:hypothetical protein n=1 Tax=uncultured Bacteroides sp. TaxID=162156 RepID=UPI002AAC104A|nr:hypothetical protein [uncultured Bacteroides sp.]
MPYRRLPNTDQARLRALNTAVDKASVCSLDDLPFSLKTLTEARNFLPHFKAAQFYYRECYSNQSKGSRKHLANIKTARLYLSHFIQVLNLAVLRSEIKFSHKEMYGLRSDSFSIPDLLSESSIAEWGHKIIAGETLRTSQGGVPIYNPTIAKVKVHYDIFLESYERQKNFQALTASSLETLASMRPQADNIILDIWDQVESKFALLGEQRLNKCREFGLIYYYRKGENI